MHIVHKAKKFRNSDFRYTFGAYMTTVLYVNVWKERRTKTTKTTLKCKCNTQICYLKMLVTTHFRVNVLNSVELPVDF